MEPGIGKALSLRNRFNFAAESPDPPEHSVSELGVCPSRQGGVIT
jgi:hypothetical protein